jgi:hypothetical protein
VRDRCCPPPPPSQHAPITRLYVVCRFVPRTIPSVSLFRSSHPPRSMSTIPRELSIQTVICIQSAGLKVVSFNLRLIFNLQTAPGGRSRGKSKAASHQVPATTKSTHESLERRLCNCFASRVPVPRQSSPDQTHSHFVHRPKINGCPSRNRFTAPKDETLQLLRAWESQ